MVSLGALWLPIVLSAVIVFVVSSVLHMLLRHHQGDFASFAAEDAVMDALRPFNIPPGDYFMPRPADMKAMRSPAYQEKMAKGPVMVTTVYPNGRMSMGASLAQWFTYSLVISVFAGYVASRALRPGAVYLDVFRFAGTVAFAGYSLGLLQDSIWYRRKWSTTLKYAFDGLVYALFTAGTFGWLWPKM